MWLALVVLLPSLCNVLATTTYPVPSRVEMIQAVREASDAATAEGSKLLSKYYEDHPELAAGDAAQAMNDFNIIRVAAAPTWSTGTACARSPTRHSSRGSSASSPASASSHRPS
jgi:ABC-2 type transport system permease protein